MTDATLPAHLAGLPAGSFVERVSAVGGDMVYVPPPPRILALDLASVRTGWCLYRTEHHWQAGSERHTGATLNDRLVSLSRWLLDLIITQAPRDVWVEVPDFERRAIRNRPGTLKALYMAHGVVVNTVTRVHPMPSLWERDAGLVRERLVGFPSATKADVQITLRRRGFVLPTRNGRVDHDAADALALAVTVADELAMLARKEA